MKPYTLDEAETELRAAIDADDLARIKILERIVDDLDDRQIVSLHAAALWYAEQGLHVFPLSPGSKIPFKGSSGCKDATSALAVVDEWWRETPEANIGIATGHLVDVIDVDGATGVASVLPILDDLPPVIGKVSTPRSGGNHYYVAAVAGRGNRAGVLAGVDYRGAGGYVVAPPSVILDGPNPGRYSWYRPLELGGAA